MEEEATRINQGQVPEPLPSNLMKVSHQVPSSINAIFSPPVNQFECIDTPPTPLFNPFSPTEGDLQDVQHFQVPDVNEDIEMDQQLEARPTPAARLFKGLEQSEDGSDAPAHDSDDEEHIPAYNKSNDAPEPSAEEVDAALAELDSIPDELCDAEDDDGEEEEEEEWSYIRMDQQTHTQGEDNLTKSVCDMASEVASLGSAGELPKSPVNDINDFIPSYETRGPLESPLNPQAPEFTMTGSFYGTLPGGPASPMEAAPAEFDTASSDLIPAYGNDVDLSTTVHNEPFIPMENQNNGYSNSPPHSPTSGSPPRTGSPRSVEGFITSVDLNTPEESYNTNLAINQTDPSFIIGGEVQQNSGPISVYVSSSPEPSSLENPSTPPPTDKGPEELLNMNGENPMVEIVHAQSCVEVPSSPPPSDVIALEDHTEAHIASPTSEHMETEETQPISPSSDKEMETHPISPVISESNNVLTENLLEMETRPISPVICESNVQSENLFDAHPMSPNMPEAAMVETSSIELTCTSNIMPFELPQAVVSSEPVEIEKAPEPASEPLLETITDPIIEYTRQETIEASKLIEDVAPFEPQPASSEPQPAPSEPQPAPSEPQPAPSEPQPASVELQPAPVEPQPKPEAAKEEKPKSPVAEVKAKTPAKATPGKTTKTPTSKTTPSTPKPASATKTKPSGPTPKTSRTPKAGTPTPTRAATSKAAATKSSTATTKPATAKPTTPKPTATKPSTTKPAATKPAVTKPAAERKPTTTRPTSSTTARPTATPKTTTTAPKSTTATKRPTPTTTTRPANTRPGTKPTADKTDGKMVNGTATRPTPTAPRRPTSSTTSTVAKKPTTTLAPGTRKPTPTTTAAKSSAVAKETKNTANRAVASKTASTATSRTTATAASRTTATNRTTATSRTTSATTATKTASSTTKSAVASRTVSSAKSATTMSKVNGTTAASKTTKTLSKTSTTAAKTSVGVKKSSVSKTSTASTKSESVAVTSATEAATAETAELIVLNGENKIAEEETSVEVKEKMEVEGISTESHVTSSVSETITTSEISEKMITETIASEEVVAAETKTEILVNGGDH